VKFPSRSLLAAAALGAIAAALPTSAQTPDAGAYRNHALTRNGDVGNGRRLFSTDPRLNCANCHSVDGTASKAGPDLQSAGDAFGRRDLIQSILQPSATISPGYGLMTVETRDGRTLQGTLKKADDSGIELMGGDGQRVRIATADVFSRTGSTTSLMPEGLQTALSLQEFTDLVEYLASLRQPAHSLATAQGMPTEIPELATPVGIRPFFERPFTLPPGKVHTGLTSIHAVPGSEGTFLVLHQRGFIWRLEKSTAGESRSDFLDLTGEVFSDRGPNGLLHLAFHPQVRANRRYFIKYQVLEKGTVTTVLVERELTADLKSDSGKPGRRLIAIPSVAEDHSGGCVDFGPDGFLYFAMGDTGPHHDPNGHAQNMGLLLGKMLRLDVDRIPAGEAYGIPSDNPFVGQAGVRPEIWASGLRNPWRFTFDPVNGNLWVADVGQDREEEVDLVRKGDNLGWNVLEGFEAFSSQYRKEGRTFVPPVFAYGRKFGNSITGGPVFRGDPKSSFDGVYFCADFNSKRLFGVRQENGTLKQVHQLGVLPDQPVSFGRDHRGGILAVGFAGTVFALDLDSTRFDAVKKP
jgi:putative heme-binding domain-containing protein